MRLVFQLRYQHEHGAPQHGDGKDGQGGVEYVDDDHCTLIAQGQVNDIDRSVDKPCQVPFASSLSVYKGPRTR